MVLCLFEFEFRLRDFFVLRTFSETIYVSWSQKEEISRSVFSYIVYIHICAWLDLSLWKFRNRLRLALVVFWPSASLAGLMSSIDSVPLSILLSLKQCDPQLLRSGAKDLVRRWTCWFHQIFASSASSETKIGKTFDESLTCDETTRSRTVRVRK